MVMRNILLATVAVIGLTGCYDQPPINSTFIKPVPPACDSLETRAEFSNLMNSFNVSIPAVDHLISRTIYLEGSYGPGKTPVGLYNYSRLADILGITNDEAAEVVRTNGESIPLVVSKSMYQDLRDIKAVSVDYDNQKVVCEATLLLSLGKDPDARMELPVGYLIQHPQVNGKVYMILYGIQEPNK